MRRLLPCLALALLASAAPADAQEIAFVSERDGNPEIYAMNVDGTGERNLSRSAGPDESPAWSPDGERIAFARGFGSDADIWVMAADGSAQQQLTDAAGPDRSPDWSPDGRRIVFVSERSGQAELHVMDAGGGGVAPLTQSGGVAASPAWSPDGSRIAYWREDVAQIWVIGADGTGDRPVATGEEQADRDPTWSPDGRRLAFTTLRDPARDLDVFSMGPDGSAPTPLAASGSRDTDPAYGADGRIAFASDRDGNLDVWVMAGDGSGQRRVTTARGDDYAPDWRPPAPAFSGALPPAGGEITVPGTPAQPPRPGTRPGTTRPRTQATGPVTLRMRSSNVALVRGRLVVTLRFTLSAPATGTFRVHHRGFVVATKLHRGRRGANVVRITRPARDAKRWTGVYRLSVVNLRRR